MPSGKEYKRIALLKKTKPVIVKELLNLQVKHVQYIKMNDKLGVAHKELELRVSDALSRLDTLQRYKDARCQDITRLKDELSESRALLNFKNEVIITQGRQLERSYNEQIYNLHKLLIKPTRWERFKAWCKREWTSDTLDVVTLPDIL